MALVSAELKFGALTSAIYPSGYDSTKLNLGPLIYQYVEGGNEGSFVGPVPVALARPYESASAKVGTMPWAMNWSPTIDWIFFADGAAAGTSPRNLIMYTFNKTTHSFAFQGYITMAFPQAATNYTGVAMRMTYDKYTTGTASCSGTTAVTGSGSTWTTDRLATGSRIGFGTTDPTAVTTWYEIGTIVSNTSITLALAGPTTGGYVPYVIEELRCVMVTTNSTPANGGVYIVKGLRPEIFTSGGTAISAATSTDNIRAVYWLSDTATMNNQTAKGCGIETRTPSDWQNHYLWVYDGVASPNEILYKYNLRALLTLTTGKNSTPFEGFVFKTGAGGAITGAPSAISNMRLAQVVSGPGAGQNCLYFTTATRIYRTAAVGTIISGSTTWLTGGDVMTEVPPGSTALFAVTGALNTLEFASTIDKFVVLSTHTAGTKSYITSYNANNSQMDRIFLSDFRQTPQVSSDGQGYAIIPNTLSISGATCWVEGGLCYLCIPGTTAITNFIYAIPIGADWEYTNLSNNVVITPSISTPNCTSFNRVMYNAVRVLGNETGNNIGASTEACRISYRTSGITDNTGGWNLLDDSGSLSNVAAATAIQFKIEFRTIGHTCLPARLLSLTVNYNDTSTDTHFQASVAQSNISTSTFAWRFSTAFGGTPPTLYVRLYDATNASTMYVSDNSAAPTGTWQYSTNGGSNWSNFPLSDKGNETTYIKYTPASLGSGIKVRAVLSLA
jgi:hypothetical protein